MSDATPATIAEKPRTPYACPRCGARPCQHGKGGEEACKDQGNGTRCQGCICGCEEDSDHDEHGETFDHPCINANCYHCGWSGELPAPPRKLLPWEKKALAAGWLAPPGWQGPK